MQGLDVGPALVPLFFSKKAHQIQYTAEEVVEQQKTLAAGRIENYARTAEFSASVTTFFPALIS